MTEDRVTVQEAARRLGVKEDAVRKRIRRGSLRSDVEDGRRYVYLDTTQDEAEDTTQDAARVELVDVLRDEIAHLRRESERKDAIIMSLSQANAEMSRTIRAIEAPTAPEEPPEVPEMGAAAPDRGEVSQEAEKPTERPWWRRVFGV